MIQVTNFEEREAINYDIEPETEFQKFISLPRAGELLELCRIGITIYLLLLQQLLTIWF